MSTVTSVIIDAPVAGSPVAKIAGTAVASAAISFQPGRLGKLLLNNVGPNIAYVLVGVASGILATVPGATFGPGGIACAVGDKPTIDVSRLKPDAAGLLWISIICDATQTATLLCTSY